MKITLYLLSAIWKNYCQRNKRIVITLAIPFAFIGCGNNHHIKEGIQRMQSEPVEIPFAEMLCIRELTDSLPYAEDEVMPFQLVSFTDSSRCSTCVLNALSEWNALLNLERERKVQFVFILQPQKQEIEEVIHTYYHSGLEHPVWIDTCGTFLKNNPQIPNGRMFHTFLLDKDRKILLVGNPLANNRIREIFDSLTTDEGISDI